jgi:hypothetical protein
MTIQYFYTGGDSFAFGQELGLELPPSHLYDFTQHHRASCYSGIMSDTIPTIKIYNNKSLPGGSNERSYRKMVTTISEVLSEFEPENIFVTISLTHAYRREFYTTYFNNWYPCMYTFEPNDDPCRSLWKILTTDFNHDKGIYMFDILQILGIQNFLINNHIPYLLTSSMGNFLEKIRLTNSVPSNVINQIYTKRYYDDISFHYFTEQNGFSRGPGLHPLEEAHAAWAQHLLDYINKHDLFSNKDLL